MIKSGTRQTIRLYDIDIIKKLNEVLENKNGYKHRNELWLEIINLGLINYEKTKQADNELELISQQNKKLCELALAQNKLLETLDIKYGKMLSCIYHILYGQVSKQEVLIDLLDEGFYDEMPYRFSNEMDTS